MKNKITCLLLLSVVIIASCIGENLQLKRYRIAKNGYYGYIDSLGNEAIKPNYLYATNFSEGLALVLLDTLYIGTTIDYSKCHDFLDSMRAEANNCKINYKYEYAYINVKNKIVIKDLCMFSEDDRETVKLVLKGDKSFFEKYLFRNNRALFQDKNTKKYGYIGVKGNMIIEPKYFGGQRFSEDFAGVNFSDSINKPKWGYIDKNGNTVIEGKYSSVRKFSENIAIVYISDSKKTKDGSIAFSMNTMAINKSGNMITSPLISFLNYIYDYNDGVAIVENRLFSQVNGYKFMDTKGNFTTDFELIDVTKHSNGYAGVKQNNDKWIFIDKNINLASKDEYDNVQPFSDGYAAVKKDDKWGYIDTAFNQVIPFKFDYCTKFIDGLAQFIIKSNNLVIDGYINKNGDIIWQNEYNEWDEVPQNN